MARKVRPKKTERLKYLRERVKRCWYCKCPLVYYPLKSKEVPPPNYATIEHLNSRLQYPNGRPKAFGKERTLVVACRACNEERGNSEVARLSIEEKRQRGNSYPLGEDTCQRCISPNPVWFAPNELWNSVVNDEYHFLCPNCFIELAESGGLKTSVWSIKMESNQGILPTKEKREHDE